MRTIKVDKKELLSHLRANRTAHIVAFDEAMVGYRKELVTCLGQMLKKAKNQEDVDHRVNIVRPTDFTEFYDNAITMLEWTVDEFIELDMNEFNQYIQDEWSWKQNFNLTNSLYAGK